MAHSLLLERYGRSVFSCFVKSTVAGHIVRTRMFLPTVYIARFQETIDTTLELFNRTNKEHVDCDDESMLSCSAIVIFARSNERFSEIFSVFDLPRTTTSVEQKVTPDMVQFMEELRKRITVGVVGGSDLPKQKEQLGDSGE